jgi:integrase
MAILERLNKVRAGELVFWGVSPDKPIANESLFKTIKRVGGAEASTHGLRSSFRDWAGDETEFPREVAEAALAHAVGDQSEQAYRRGDAFKKRRALMQAWSDYLLSEVEKVVRLPTKRRA